jgi:hypothetical protein
MSDVEIEIFSDKPTHPFLRPEKFVRDSVIFIRVLSISRLSIAITTFIDDDFG